MGIKSLWSYINSHFPSCHKGVPQASFAGLRIAFDMGAWIFPFRKTARSSVIMRTNVIDDPIDERLVDERWLNALMEKLLRFLVHDITPILVFDGPSPIQKTDTKLKRSKKNDEILAQIEQVRGEIDALKGRPLEMLEQRPTLLPKLQKLMCDLTYIPADSIANIRRFFEGIGIPTVQAVGEAERLAATLCREGIAAAAYSPDGDTLAHLCPVLIRDIGVETYVGSTPEPTFEMVYLQDILDGFQLSPSQFVDLCIMSGCDYNENIKGVGIAGSLKLIQQYGTLDALDGSPHGPGCPNCGVCKKLVPLEGGELKHDLSSLNYQVCRELFAPVAWEQLIPAPMSFNMDAELTEPARDMFEHFDVVRYVERYARIFQKMSTPRDFSHSVAEDMGGFVVEDGDILEGVTTLSVRRSQVEKAKKPAKPPARSGEREGRGGRGGGRGRGGMRNESKVPISHAASSSLPVLTDI